jgi:hypothetical protein
VAKQKEQTYPEDEYASSGKKNLMKQRRNKWQTSSLSNLNPK